MNFSEKMKNWQGMINEKIDQTLPGDLVPPAQLHQAMRHSMNAGGKRLPHSCSCWTQPFFQAN